LDEARPGGLRLLVVAEHLGRLGLAEALLGAEAVADVAQVAQGAEQVAFENVGVEVLDLATAHGLDEVAEVILAAGELLDDLAVVADGDAGSVAGAHQDALAAVEDVADEVVAALAGLRRHLLRVGVVAGQAAHLEDELAVAVVEDAHLRV